MTELPMDNADQSALKRALFALKDMRARLDAVERTKNEPIAIIWYGMPLSWRRQQSRIVLGFAA